MNAITNDCIAIDTNVFGHLTNSKINLDGHINKLLRRLQQDGVKLLIDSTGAIRKEYDWHFSKNKILSSNVKTDEPHLLLYWLWLVRNKTIAVDCNDSLSKQIEKIIPEPKENTDRTFVYVALKNGSSLISNDKKHIVNIHRKKALQNLNNWSKILKSSEAADML